MRRLLSFILPLVGLGLFAFIVVSTGPENIARVVSDVDPKRLALSPLIVLIIMLVRGIRWKYLINASGLEYSLARASTVWTIGFFASAVTPAKAGDAVRAFYVQEDTGCSFGTAFLTVFIDRIWDLLFVLLAGVVTVLIYSRTYIEVPSLWIVLAAALGMIGVVYLMTRRDLMKRVLGPLFRALVPHRYQERFALNFHSFYDSLTEFNRHWHRHAVAFLLTLVCWGLIFVLAYYVATMLGIDVSFGYLILIWPIVTVIELVPVSISGLGTRDAILIYFLGAVGVTSAQAVGFSLAYVIIGTYLSALFGFLFWLRHPVKLGGD